MCMEDVGVGRTAAPTDQWGPTARKMGPPSQGHLTLQQQQQQQPLRLFLRH